MQAPGHKPWPADCGSLLEGCLESFPTWQRDVCSPRALRVLLLCGAHHVPVTPSSLSVRRTGGSECPLGDRSSCRVRRSPGPSRRRPPRARVCGPGSRPPPQVGADAAAATRRTGRGPGADVRAARSPDSCGSCGSRGPQRALSGRARQEHGVRGDEARQPDAAAGGELSQPRTTTPPPAAAARDPSDRRPLPTRDLRPPPRQPVPKKVVDETWLTPVLGSLVRRRRHSSWCGCCLRDTSSPSAILYRFKINSPLTSNAAAALSTSREPVGRRTGPSAALSWLLPESSLVPPIRARAPPLPCRPAAQFSWPFTSGRN